MGLGRMVMGKTGVLWPRCGPEAKTGVLWPRCGPEAHGRLGEACRGDTTTPVGDRDAEITCGALKGIEKRA